MRRLWINCNQDRISILNAKSGQPKEEIKVYVGTKGLPKAPKSYGSRETIVPCGYRLGMSNPI